MTDADMARPAADDYPKDPEHAPAVGPDPAHDVDEGSEELEELEGAEVEMQGEAHASADSLAKEQPPKDRPGLRERAT